MDLPTLLWVWFLGPAFTWLDPVLAPYLSSRGISKSVIGLAFGVLALALAIVAPFIG
jgi:hypothetical protein